MSHPEPLAAVAQSELRPPSTVMRLERMGAFFPTRLSFMRTLIRRLSKENAQITCPVFKLDDKGFGHAVYSVPVGGHTYSLVAFSTALDPDKRTDRVIAEAWDSSYALFDGIPTDDDIKRLEQNVPKQEAGRCSANELVLSRANKSLRLFDYVADCLARGEQPDVQKVIETGYLMRTTAVYGNGKFGIADRAKFAERDGLSGPFQAEMLTVFLIRHFTHDLVEHVARIRGGERAVLLSPEVKRHLGIGNSTGLGMAPFLVSHPTLINNWMMVRETALARVRAVEHLEAAARRRVLELMQRAMRHLIEWSVEDTRQDDRIKTLRTEWADFSGRITDDWLRGDFPYERLLNDVEHASVECQELVVALCLEPNGDLVDGLDECMTSAGERRLDPSMRIGTLRALIDEHFDWAKGIDFDDEKNAAQFWYVSEEKLEPRLGSRFEEPGAELEMPLDIARRAQALGRALQGEDDSQSLAAFLLRYPDHRYIVRRLQLLAAHPYAEIRDNLIGENCLPIDMLRCKLSFFGASKFDPKSDRWTRVTLFQGAPLAEELSARDADDWWLPALSL